MTECQKKMAARTFSLQTIVNIVNTVTIVAIVSIITIVSLLNFVSCSSGSGGNAEPESIAIADPFQGYDSLVPIQQMPGVVEIDPPVEVIESREMLEDQKESVQPEQNFVKDNTARPDLQFRADRIHRQCTVKTYEAAPGYDEQFLMSPFSNFYPGAVYDGTTIANGGYRAIQDGVRKPLMVTAVGMNGLSGPSSKIMTSPNLAQYTDFLNDLLSRAQAQSLEPIANSTYTEVSHYDTTNFRNSLRIGLSADAGTVKLNLTSGFSEKKKTENNRVFFRFNQVHFTVSLSDAAPGFENWYSSPPVLQNNVAPVYVDYIKYGRVFIVSVETSVNEEQVKNYFDLNFAAPNSKVDIDRKNDYKNVIGNSQINVYVVGGDQALCNNIRDAESLRNCATQGGLSYINASPVAYGLKYVHDGTAVKVLVNTSYQIRECDFQVLQETVRQRLHLAAIREIRPAPLVDSCPRYRQLCHNTLGFVQCRRVEDGNWSAYCNTTFPRVTRPVHLQGGLGMIQTAETTRGFLLDPENREDVPCFDTSGTPQDRNVIFSSGGRLAATQTFQVQPGTDDDLTTWLPLRKTLDPQKELVYDLNSDKKFLKVCSSIRPSIVGADAVSYPTLTGSWVINPFDIPQTGTKLRFSDANGRETEYCLYSDLADTIPPSACGVSL